MFSVFLICSHIDESKISINIKIIYLGFIALKTLNYVTFQSLDFQRTYWRWFQKRVMRTNFDIFKLFLDVNVSPYTKCKIKINKHLILIKIVFCDIGKTKHHIHIYFTNAGSNYLSVPTQTHILISTSFKQTVIFGADVDKWRHVSFFGRIPWPNSIPFLHSNSVKKYSLEQIFYMVDCFWKSVALDNYQAWYNSLTY